MLVLEFKILGRIHYKFVATIKTVNLSQNLLYCDHHLNQTLLLLQQYKVWVFNVIIWLLYSTELCNLLITAHHRIYYLPVLLFIVQFYFKNIAEDFVCDLKAKSSDAHDE